MFSKKLRNKTTGLRSDVAAFYTLDALEIAEHMKLADRGQQRGVKNLPASDTNAMDDIEQEILSKISQEESEARQRTLNQISAYEERLHALGSSGEIADYNTLTREAKAGFNANIRDARGELFIARRYVVDAERQLKKFQEKHEIDRIAKVPNTAKLIMFLIILFAVETVPNAFFLGESNPLGLLGGWLEAVIFSALYVVRVFWTQCIKI